jgi:hypothetical protein
MAAVGPQGTRPRATWFFDQRSPEGLPVSTDTRHLDRHLEALERNLPERPAGWIRRLRQPRARMVRISAGIAFLCGGVLGFLPVLGFWMVPLGLLLLAYDVPPLRHPTVRALDWLERRVHGRDDA